MGPEAKDEGKEVVDPIETALSGLGAVLPQLGNSFLSWPRHGERVADALNAIGIHFIITLASEGET